MHENFVHLLILSYAVASRENVQHIFRSLEEPKILNLVTVGCSLLRDKEKCYSFYIMAERVIFCKRAGTHSFYAVRICSDCKNIYKLLPFFNTYHSDKTQ